MFKRNTKYTIVNIDSMMALTHKREIEVVDFQPNKLDPAIQDVIFKPRGKRKLYVLPLKTRSYQYAPIVNLDDAVFEGWDLPLHIDTEYNMYRGNACYNFVGEPSTVRVTIDAGQLNPHFDKVKVLAHPDNKGDGVVVYPELYKGGHAVIDRLLAVA